LDRRAEEDQGSRGRKETGGGRRRSLGWGAVLTGGKGVRRADPANGPTTIRSE
jgi:hypothetical protein